MNDKTKQALEQALVALELYMKMDTVEQSHILAVDLAPKSITAIKEALAEQPAQQGVDWEKLYRLEVKKKEALAVKYERDTGKQLTSIVPMAEQPAQRCSLCNYQHGHAIGCKNNPVDIALNKMAQNARELGLNYESSAGTQVSKVWWDGDKLMAKPIPLENIYKEPEQQQQEPVAWMVKAHGMLQRLSRRADVADEIACQYRKDDPNAEVFPLYTSPPASKPLTDEEIDELSRSMVKGDKSVNWLCRAIEAAHGITGEQHG